MLITEVQLTPEEEKKSKKEKTTSRAGGGKKSRMDDDGLYLLRLLCLFHCLCLSVLV